MNLTQKIFVVMTIAAVSVSALGTEVQADDGVKQINRANQALLDGDVEAALDQYQLVEQSAQPTPLLAYNKGVALYRQGEIEQARRSFTVALETDDPKLAAQAAFNLGNCHYANALGQSESEPNVAIESLRTAIEHYRSAVQINESDTDARTNIELAGKLIQQLAEEQKQQEEQQQQEQQQNQDQQQCENQDCQNQGSDDSEDGKEDSSESESQDSQDQSQADSSSNEKQSSESSANQDSGEENDSQWDDSGSESNTENSQSEKSDSQKPNDNDIRSDGNSSESGETNEEPTDQQSSPVQEQDQERSSERTAEEQQTLPGEQQTQADSEAGEESADQEKSGEQMSAVRAGQQGEQPDGELKPGYAISESGEPVENIDEEEALKMLQAIRDRDLMRRMNKLNETRRRYRPVDRDW